jgi:hypothetical protein
MEAWRVCWPVVEDSQHFDEKEDPDPHWSEKLFQIRIRKTGSGLHLSDADPQPCVNGLMMKKMSNSNMCRIEAAFFASELDRIFFFFFKSWFRILRNALVLVSMTFMTFFPCLLFVFLLFVQMLAKYDQDVVKNLMPLIVNVLGKTVFKMRMFSIQSSVRYGTGTCIYVQAVQLKVICYRETWPRSSPS